MAFDAAQYLYTVESFNCTLAGVKYAVSGVTLAVQDSGVPTAVLVINPQPNPNPKIVVLPTVEDFSGWQAALQSKVNTPAGIGSLSFSLKCKADIQKIDIKDWSLVQVGFDKISAAGDFSTVVVLQHPIYKAATGVMAMLNTYKAGAEGDPLTGGDVIAMMLDGMDKYLQQREPGNTALSSDTEAGVNEGTIQAIDKKSWGVARASLDALKDNIQWDPDYAGGKFPLVTISDAVKDYLSLGGLAPDMYLLDRGSPYHTLMTMAGEMMLTSRSGFNNDKLKFRPMEPWAKSALKIKIQDVSQIDLPIYTANPVNAVGVLGAACNTDLSTLEKGNISKQTSANPQDIALIGGFFDFASKLKGFSKLINMPGWLSSYDNGTPSGGAYDDRNGNNSDTAINNSGRNPNADEARDALMTDWNAIANAVGQDEFWRSFRAEAFTSLGTRLMITTPDGKPVLPGFVCDVVSGDGTVVISCYITTVQHTISVSQCKAYTSIGGVYSRTAGGVTGIYSPGQDVKSRMYNASGGPSEAAAATDSGSGGPRTSVLVTPASAEAWYEESQRKARIAQDGSIRLPDEHTTAPIIGHVEV